MCVCVYFLFIYLLYLFTLYKCMDVWMYLWMDGCMYVCTYVRTYMYVYVCMCRVYYIDNISGDASIDI